VPLSAGSHPVAVHEILFVPQYRLGRFARMRGREAIDLLQRPTGSRHNFAHVRRRSFGAIPGTPTRLRMVGGLPNDLFAHPMTLGLGPARLIAGKLRRLCPPLRRSTLSACLCPLGIDRGATALLTNHVSMPQRFFRCVMCLS